MLRVHISCKSGQQIHCSLIDIRPQSFTFQDTGERASNVRVKVDVAPSEGEVDVELRSVGQIQDIVPDNHLLIRHQFYHFIIFDNNISQCLGVLLTHFVS